MKKSKLLLAFAAAVLVITTCSLEGKLQRPSDSKYNPFIERAAMPVITTHPKDYTYFVGDAPTPPVLAVTVAPPTNEGAEISYRWFQNIEPSTNGATVIMSATSPTYTPTVDTTAVGTNYYFVSVTHFDPAAESGYEYTSVNSKVVQVSVTTDRTATMTANATITIDTATQNQYVRGFGGMSAPWNNVPNITRADIETMFNPDKLGYNILRIMIMPDNVDIAKTMEDMLNLEIHASDTKIQGKMYYDFVKTVNGYGGYVLASPWSPPAEWKSDGTINGHAYLKPGYYLDYAKYLRSFAQIMYDNGAPIYVMSIQNEPNYQADYDGCDWTDNELRDFFMQVGHFTGAKDDPGAAIQLSAFATRIPGYGGGKPTDYVLTMNGESANRVTVNTPALNEPMARDAIDVLGRHFYNEGDVNGPYALGKDNNKEMWMTEHNINSGSAAAFPNDSTWRWVWKFMNDIDRSIRYCNENAFIWWYAKRFYSMIGDGEYSTTNGTILPRGHGLSHYAKFASEMWRCNLSATGTVTNATNGNIVTIAASNFNTATPGIDSVHARATAFVSDDGNTISLVMFTPTKTDGSDGFDMGTVKIQLPDGFVARGAVAMRSTSSVQSKWEDVALSADRKSAFVTMPRGQILSVKFTK